jgi:FlaG/FlaF family flagellin (archaellin)
MNTTREHYREYPARSSGARVGLIVAIIAILAIIAAFAFGFIDINQTRQGQAPSISVSGGQAPAFDVDTAKVNIGSKDSSVTVPKIDVGTKEETVKVPTIDVKKAN